MSDQDKDILRTLIAVVTHQENQQEQLKEMTDAVKETHDMAIKTNVHLENQMNLIKETRVDVDMLDQRIRPIEARQGEYKRVMGMIAITLTVIGGIATLLGLL